jgi:DNA-binding transcriptional MerR regulator
MSERTERVEPRPITIGALSRATQIPVETLRTWERRYLSPVPIRKPSGHRLYPVSAIEHLRRVAHLLERGHRPAEILRLSIAELDALLAAADQPRRHGRRVPAVRTSSDVERSLEAMMRATVEFDRDALLAELESHWARLGPLSFLERIAAPFLEWLGEAWESGDIRVRHEHFASQALGDFLRAVREPYDDRAGGPRVIAATPSGELHEGGLLMATVILSVRERRLVYLGRDTPVAEIAAASREQRAEAVLISISKSMPASRARRFIADLRRALQRPVALWVGGGGAPADRPGIERFETLAQLDERLAR